MKVKIFFTLAFLTILVLSYQIADAKIIGAWLFDEGKGDIAKDSSGNDVDGELKGGPAWVDGKFGKALKIEPNKYVDFPQPKSSKMILDKQFTCMAWIYPNKWESGWNCVFSMQAGSSNGETYGIYFGNSGGTEILCWTKLIGVGGKSVTSGVGSVKLSEWVHGTITYDGTKLIAYKNGEKAGETPVTGDMDNGDKKGRFVIGGNYNSLDGGLSEWSSTTVDEVLVFDNALTADEVKTYMNKGFGGSTAVNASEKLATKWSVIKGSNILH